jgi:hypothetical protein
LTTDSETSANVSGAAARRAVRKPDSAFALGAAGSSYLKLAASSTMRSQRLGSVTTRRIDDRPCASR